MTVATGCSFPAAVGQVLKLTEIHLYGTTLLYDVHTRLLMSWEPNENPDDVIGYAHVPTRSPSEVPY